MYATIRKYKLDPKGALDVLKGFETGLLPIFKGMPGFVSYNAMNGGNGIVFSVTIFTSQSGAEASNKKAAEWVAKNLPSLLPTFPEITLGEVAVHEVNPNPK